MVCPLKTALLHVLLIFASHYFVSGWKGSMADSTLFDDAHQTNFYIPRGRYYLADAGFVSSDALLVPYQNLRSHLSEWNHAKGASVVHLLLKISH